MFAGPNGSGKSTITPSFQTQPDFPSNYINPDEIALSLGGKIMERAYEASAIAANHRDECIRNGSSFAFETVMSHPSKLALLEKAKDADFDITLVFISTNISNTEAVLHHLSLIDSIRPVSQIVTIKYQDGVSSLAIA